MNQKKIVLIVDALLNEAASNCLFKTLEEPITEYLFINIRINVLIDTIIEMSISRFKPFSFELKDFRKIWNLKIFLKKGKNWQYLLIL